LLHVDVQPSTVARLVLRLAQGAQKQSESDIFRDEFRVLVTTECAGDYVVFERCECLTARRLLTLVRLD